MLLREVGETASSSDRRGRARSSSSTIWSVARRRSTGRENSSWKQTICASRLSAACASSASCLSFIAALIFWRPTTSRARTRSPESARREPCSSHNTSRPRVTRFRGPGPIIRPASGANKSGEVIVRKHLRRRGHRRNIARQMASSSPSSATSAVISSIQSEVKSRHVGFPVRLLLRRPPPTCRFS